MPLGTISGAIRAANRDAGVTSASLASFKAALEIVETLAGAGVLRRTALLQKVVDKLHP